MTFAELKTLLEQIASAVARLRQTLETNNMDALPEALEQTRVALELINGYPEGPEKLKSDINQYPEEQKQILHGLLDQASVDHQINGDLIRLAMQRSAAIPALGWVAVTNQLSAEAWLLVLIIFV